MALSPAHRFGQIIGDLLETATVEKVQPIVAKHNMYLDYTHSRPARYGSKKIHVQDVLGNYHDLDLVIEEGGSEETFGTPRAFIEVAWRRYTKHSKNKAQEISSAVLACARKYADNSPFMGTVLAGEFTENSIKQLRSQGFVVVHFTRQAVINAFATVGINAAWQENTPENVILEEVKRYDHLQPTQINRIKNRLFLEEKDAFDIFTKALDASLERRIETVTVVALWGISQTFKQLSDARNYIEETLPNGDPDATFLRFEVSIDYSNGSKMKMQFINKREALAKLSLLDM